MYCFISAEGDPVGDDMPRRTTLQDDIRHLLSQSHVPSGISEGLSRNEIASRLGYGERSLSEALRAMTRSGELMVSRAHAPGSKYRVLTYRLTRLGANRARSSPQLPPPNLPDGAEPFVGRARELADLGRAYLKGGVCVVDGVPGVGKTALVRRSLRFVWKTHFPIWTTLKDLGPEALATQVVQSLAALRPRAAEGSPAPPIVDSAARTIATHLRGVGRPLLWILDDVQSASPETLTTLRAALAEILPTGNVTAILITHRELPWSIPGRTVFHLSVQGLPRRDALALTQAMGLPEVRFETVYRETLGNPRFLRLSVGSDEVAEMSFADSVLESLPEEQRRALGTIALLWGGTSSTLVSAAGLPEASVEALLSRSVLERTEQGIRVVEPLAQRLRETLDWGDARLAHAWLAARTPPLPLPERFCHLVGAEQVDEAARLMVKERMELVEDGDPRVLSAALRLAHLLPQGSDRGRVFVVVAEMLRLRGDFVASSSFLHRALEDLPPEDDGALLATVLLVNASLRAGQVSLAEETVSSLLPFPPEHRWATGALYARGTLAQSRGDPKEAHRLFTEAAERARRLDQAELRALAILGLVHVTADLDPKAHLRMSREGAKIVAACGRHDLDRAIRVEEALAQLHLGALAEAEGLYTRILAESRRAGARPFAVVALLGLAYIRSQRKELKEAVSLAQEAAQTAEGIHDRSLTSRAYASLAELLRRSGNRESALRIARRARSLAQEGGFAEHIPYSEEALALASDIEPPEPKGRRPVKEK